MRVQTTPSRWDLKHSVCTGTASVTFTSKLEAGLVYLLLQENMLLLGTSLQPVTAQVADVLLAEREQAGLGTPPTLYASTFLEMNDAAVKNGTAPAPAPGGAYASILSPIYHDFQAAYQWRELALAHRVADTSVRYWYNKMRQQLLNAQKVQALQMAAACPPEAAAQAARAGPCAARPGCMLGPLRDVLQRALAEVE